LFKEISCFPATSAAKWSMYCGGIFHFYVFPTLYVTTMKQVAISAWN
jgi:hypothetical protein